MKKLILKTIFVTVGIALILLFAVFGVLSLWAPVAMMNFSSSLGMEGISGDYAFQEYERSGNISYLAKSFEIAADLQSDRKANERFALLYENEGFLSFCAAQETQTEEGVPALSYKDYLCGQAALVKYRLASTEEDRAAACTFAVAETDVAFPVGNPVISLAAAVKTEEDADTAQLLLSALSSSGKSFDTSSAYYVSIVRVLQGVGQA